MKIPEKAYYKPDWHDNRWGAEQILDPTNYEYCIDGTTRPYLKTIFYLQDVHFMTRNEAAAYCRKMVHNYIAELKE